MTRTAKGFLIMGLPPIVFVADLVVWAVISFIAGSLFGSDAAASGTAITALRLINAGLGFIGILSVMAIPVFVIIGLIYMVTGSKTDMPQTEPPSDTNIQNQP